MTRILQGMGISRKFFLAFVGLLMVCQLVVGYDQTKEKKFSVMADKERNRTYIIFHEGSWAEVKATYDYAYQAKRNVAFYENGACIGYLPKTSESRTAPPVGDYHRPYVLFFGSMTTGNIREITEEPGYGFSILDVKGEPWKVVVIFNAERQNIRLFRVYDDGGVDKEFSFPVDFYPDYFTIEHLEGSRYKLLASELGRKEYYTVDFDKRIVY